MSGIKLSIRVWDAPIRLFHWAIVLLVATAWVTQEFRWMTAHFITGYTIVTLLLFRLLWGVFGSETALFSKFLVSPLKGFQHLRDFRRPAPDTQIGHNASGGWMVLILLLVLVFQVGTGLFSRNKHLHAPFALLIPTGISKEITQLHHLGFWLILAATAVHVLAIAAYAFIKKQNLLQPMLTGKKRLPAATRPPRMASPALALLILLCAGLGFAIVLNAFGTCLNASCAPAAAP